MFIKKISKIGNTLIPYSVSYKLAQYMAVCLNLYRDKYAEMYSWMINKRLKMYVSDSAITGCYIW